MEAAFSEQFESMDQEEITRRVNRIIDRRIEEKTKQRAEEAWIKKLTSSRQATTPPPQDNDEPDTPHSPAAPRRSGQRLVQMLRDAQLTLSVRRSFDSFNRGSLALSVVGRRCLRNLEDLYASKPRQYL